MFQLICTLTKTKLKFETAVEPEHQTIYSELMLLVLLGKVRAKPLFDYLVHIVY